ncbi:hypothetical protein Pmar_PMAR027335 [Perkinsus marinus ATCC 50983]|uniref:Peptidase S26 domain-containing protein n=1 Tax=Perkinsus marinus (strain ATCC 50983 / TXsc) TaxID=423536 RepID=C5M1Q1_PERM5|nr:hypothetical protein Pmar_PMAR027335 [Perkinsus marinus ATCC 50983]EEQ97089.1 hypothetical protein Pmar_PMAR027335 [Perkinsus marinus ATCC 50983]|eukprot:XP_002764372.1 hypothetical protein Pmar_PMAR027335 [Perkinsus marinus ATCC 50983]
MMYISTKSVFITVAMWLLLMVGYGRVDAAEESAGGAPVNDKSGELDGGILVYNDLAHRDVLCRYIQIPAEARRIRATAAVIGLTGNPNLFSGFDEQKLRDRIYKEAAPTNQGGYHMIHDTYFVPKSSDGRFYLCVTTFATQGTDFVLTGVVSNAAEFGVEPVMPLLMEYPTVQSVEAFGRHREYRVVLPDTPSTETSDGVIPPITITVAQIVGETDLMVHACGSEQSLAVSAVDGPDTVTITNDQLSSAGLGPGSELCVVVKTNKLFASASTFWLVVSQNPQGPFVMQSLPMYAVIPGKGSQRVRRFRTYFNKGTDLTITANPVSANAVKEAASRPGELQSGSLPSIVADTTPTGQTWKDHGDGHIAIDKSSLEAHSGQGEVVYVSVTPPTGWHENSEMPFELTVTTSSTVRDLQDGKPTTVTISDSRKFRDFRYWVPKHARIVLSIVGDSSRDGSGLAIFADTTRYSHDPRGYTFNTMEGSNEIFLTNMKYYAQAHPGKVQYINCDMGYIYLTVKSCAVANGKCVEDASVPSTFTLTVSSDSGSTHVQDGVPIHEKVHMAKKFVYTNPMLDKSGKKKKEEGENNGDDNTETDSSEASSIHFNDLLVKAAVNGGRGSLMLSNDENFATSTQAVFCGYDDAGDTKADGGNICTFVIKKNDPIRSSKYIYAKMIPDLTDSTGTALLDFDFLMADMGGEIVMKNHQPMNDAMPSSGGSRKYKIFIPASTSSSSSAPSPVSAMFDVSKTTGTVEFEICDAGEKCKTIKGDGSAQLEENASKGNVAGKWMHVRAKCEDKCSYRLTGAFFLKSNSLRLNYRPMTVPLDGGSFKDWMVGYKDTDHWLLHTEVRGQEADAVKTCIKDQCCTAGTCTLYGFGKEIAKLENMKSDAISYVQLWATKLSSPVMDEWLDVSKRGSNIYRLNTNSLVSFDAEKSSTFSTGAKVTVADSLFGDYQVLSGENLIDCSGNKMKFVKVEGASRVRIHAPLNLQVGEWAYNPHWVMFSKKFGHSDSSNHMLEMGTEMDYHDIESNHEHTNTGGYRRHDVGQQLTSRPTSTYAPLRYDESLIIVLRNLAIGPGDVVTFRDPFDPKRWGMGWDAPIDCVGFITFEWLVKNNEKFIFRVTERCSTGKHLVKRVVAVEPRHRSSASIHSIDDYDELGGAGGIDTTTHSVAFEDMGGRVYVLGDNPDRSVDSRYFGPIPQPLIDGLVVAVIWPPWRASWVPRPPEDDDHLDDR